MFPSPPPPPPPPPLPTVQTPVSSSTYSQQSVSPSGVAIITTTTNSTNNTSPQQPLSFHFNEFLFYQQLQQEDHQFNPEITDQHNNGSDRSFRLTDKNSSSSSFSASSVESSIHSIQLEVTLSCQNATITKSQKNFAKLLLAEQQLQSLQQQQSLQLHQSLQPKSLQPKSLQPKSLQTQHSQQQQLSPSKVLQGELRRYRSNMNFNNNNNNNHINNSHPSSNDSFHHSSNHNLNSSQTNLKTPISDGSPIITVVKTPTSVSKFHHLTQHIQHSQNASHHHQYQHQLQHQHQPHSQPPSHSPSQPSLPSPHHNRRHSPPNHHHHQQQQQKPSQHYKCSRISHHNNNNKKKPSQHYKCSRISHHNNNNKKKHRRSLIRNSLGQNIDPEQQSSNNNNNSSSSNSQNSHSYKSTKSRNNDSSDKQIFDGSKKSRCILFSQIYLITHISITICLNEKFIPTLIGTSMAGGSIGNVLSVKEIILNLYLIYIMVVSLLFFLLLRCYATPTDSSNTNVNELTEQSPILYGAVCLGVSELLLTIFSLTRCFESEFILIPVLKFGFTLFLMHFLLTQIIHSDYIGMRNIAIAHLVSTQISLWILSLGQISSTVAGNYLLGESYRHNTGVESICNYTFDLERFRLVYPKLTVDSSSPVIETNLTTFNDPLPAVNQTGPVSARSITVPFLFLQFESFLWPTLNVLSHQFKLLTIFILITMWFTNNQSKINFIRAKLSDEEVFRSALASSSSSNLHLDSIDQTKLKRQQLALFLFGSLFIILAIVTAIFSHLDTLRYCTLILIQVSITIISLIGLFIRRRKKYLNPKYQINVLKHHFIIFSTMFVAYIDCFLNVVLQMQELFQNHKHQQQPQSAPIIITDSTMSITTTMMMSPSTVVGTNLERIDQLLAIFSCLTLIVQVTVQTYLLRLQGKKLVDMKAIFALLVCANFALLVVDINSGFVDVYSNGNSGNNGVGGGGGRRNNYRYYRHLTPFDHTTVPINQWQLAGESIRNILSIFITLNRTYCTLIFVYFWRMRT